MKRFVLIYGGIASLVLVVLSAITMTWLNPNHNMMLGMALGYSVMLISLSMIFVATKQYRDKECGGVISFWRATSMGLLIGLFATVFYIGGWEYYYHTEIPDFYSKYAEMQIQEYEKSGMDAQTLENKKAEALEMAASAENNPAFRMAFTSVEILPVVILLSVISGAVYRKKSS